MSYELISYTYHKKKCWTLYDVKLDSWPVIASIYSALNRRLKETNTQRQSFVAIAFFYNYYKKKYNISFEEKFISRNYDISLFINDADGFVSWLETGRKGINIQSIGDSEVNIKSTRIYIVNVLKFFDYLNDRYTTRKYQNYRNAKSEKSSHDSYKFKIRSKRKGLTTSDSNSKHEDYKSLTEYQIKLLEKISFPHTPKARNPFNPFRTVEKSFRNYLMVEVFNYGLRRGELHLLTTKSFKPSIDGKKHYITVTNTDDAYKFKNDSSIKTKHSHRQILITQELYQQLKFYVEDIREKTDDCRLFSMCYRNINDIFEQLTKSIHQLSPETTDIYSDEYLSSLHPHRLRHTWAIAQLHYLVETKGMTLDEAKVELRVIGGWSISSEEVEHYGRRYIEMSANEDNIKRIQGN